MKERRSFICLVLMLSLSLAIGVGSVSGGPAGNDIKALFRADEVFLQEEVLVSFGPRVAGGSAEAAAASYIADEMESFGLDVEIQEFDIIYFEELSTPVLEQVAPVQETYTVEEDFATMSYSGSGEVTAAVQPVDLDLPPSGNSTSGCEPEDFIGFGEGNIALLQRGACTFALKAQNAEEAGATGVIIFNDGYTPDHEGLLFGTLGGPGVTIPVVGTTYPLGLALSATEDPQVHMFTETVSEQRTSRNVIGTLEGTRPEQGIVYLGGHYDSVPGSPGANDNASGVAATLEAARVLSTKGHRTKATLKFIAFGAEEIGLDGSFNYIVENYDEVSEKGIGMINLDMIAVGEMLLIGNIDYGLPDTGGSQLRDFAQKKASRMGLEWDSFDAEENSDHTYFEQAGVPAVFITQRDDPYYHTSEDSLDKIQIDTLEANGELATAVMYDWAKNPLRRVRKAAKIKRVHVRKHRVHRVE